MPEKYIGWIPNLLGNLSYTLVGRSNYPNKVHCCVFEHSNAFHYLAIQQRISHDSQRGFSAVLPKKWAQKIEAYLLEKRGFISTWDAVLVGECKPEDGTNKNNQILDGEIFFIPATKSNVVSKINSINDLYLSNKSVINTSKASGEKDSLLDELNNLKSLSCHFELHRDGLCYLSKIYSTQPLEKNIENSLTENQAYNQCFFFLKDLFHTHKFHKPDYDTLTEVYPIDDNWTWAKETLKVFYRTIIRTEPEYSIGIIHYARAFKEIIKNKNEILGNIEIADGFSFLDKHAIPDKYAEDVCKARSEAKKRDLDERKWQAGLFSAAIAMTWGKISDSLLKDISEKFCITINYFTINSIVYVSIAWCVLIYVRKISLSEQWQMIKFTKYLSSIDKKENQLLTLVTIILFGLAIVIDILSLAF